ncbi:signal transduction protein [Calothrix sp. NIES-4071]|nr:signal transduction protein [Calothrix sp. NIES-4071]BAZ55594.1 signal transduction protein [Calothrix sp. NIES-4105]
MLKALKLNKRLKQQRFSILTRHLFVKVFAAYLTLFLIVALPTVSYTQTTSASRDKVVTEIKQFAKRHVDTDSALKTDFVVKLYENNKVGLTSPEIATIYEDEYTKLKEAKKSDLGEQVKDNLLWGLPWYIALVFLVLFLFKEALQKWVNARLDAVGRFFYNKFAGSRFFRATALRHYQQGLMQKYKDLKIPFRQKDKPLDICKVYVPLKVTGTTDTEQFDAKSAVNDYRRLMVKGSPGSGKSMLLKHLALSYALNELDLPDNPTPVLLELHRLSDAQKSIQQHLTEAFERDDFPQARDFVSQSLEQGTLMLLLDGLDEVNSKDRTGVVLQIKDLLDQYSKCRAIITCRTAVYKGEFNQEVNRTLEVVEFSDQQVRLFLHSWQPDIPRGKSIEELMLTLRDQPMIMALARNPLMLTIIAYLYTDTPFVLPHSRAEFYRESTGVLLDQWNREHNNANIELQHKRLILQHLALHNQDTANQLQQDRRSIDYKTVLSEVSKVLSFLNLPSEKVEEILDEIVKRSGLLLQIDGGSKYQFAHLTLQEYFAAAELIDKADDLVKRFQADPDAWRETIKLWCGLANDSTFVIGEVYKKDEITAFECLADAKKVDPVLAQTIIDHFKVRLGSVPDIAPAVEAAFAAVGADPRSRPRGKAVLKFLVQTLTTSQEQARRTAAANALSLTNLSTAAQFLANCYNNRPEAHEPLIRMGDLAVPALEPYLKNGSIKAMDDLVTIGTPDAAKVLVPLLWHQDETTATDAAWRLGALLNKPNVENVLRDYKLKEGEQQATGMNWVWQPFKEPENSALPHIAGRIAYLIAKSEVDIIPPKQIFLDPRVVVPLCSIQLANQLNLSALKTEQPTSGLVDTLKSLFSYSQDKSFVDIDFQDGSKRYKVIEEAALFLAVASTEIPNLFDLQASFIKEILETIKATKKYCYLWTALPLGIKFDLLTRFLTPQVGKPKQKDWINIYRPVKYQYSKSWHYRTLVALFVVLGLISVLSVSNIILNSSVLFSWSNALIPLATILIIGMNSWCFLLNNDSYNELREDVDFIGILILFGPIVLPIGLIIDLFNKQKYFTDFYDYILVLGLTFLFPVEAYYATILMLKNMPLIYVVLIWLTWIAAVGILWRIARKLLREARNPLTGILGSRLNSTSSHLKSKSLFRLLSFWL